VRRTLLVASVFFLLLAAPARAGGPSLILGVAEDDINSTSFVQAKTNLTIARLAGFDSIRVTSVWWPEYEAVPPDREIGRLGNIVRAARMNGMRVFLVVFHNGSATTPLTEKDQLDFASYTAEILLRIPSIRDVIIGNEPNLNRYWLPQFAEDGSSVAPQAYETLLARTYDAVKAAAPRARVIGGALSPRGTDEPFGIRPNHSPTTFIRELGLAYRASGRTIPIMDQFAIHPYQDSSSQSPATRHTTSRTITIADYPKLVRLLGEAFDGTPQPGSTMPIVYGEYGVEGIIPASQARHYEGTEASTTRPVPERTQAAYYRQALGLAFCQPTVRAMFIFHLWDERNLNRWQSGLYYANRTPKSILGPVRKALKESRRGVLARCPGLELPVRVRAFFGGAAKLARARPLAFRLACNLDCSYVATLESLPGGKAMSVVRGRVVGRTVKRIRFPARRLRPGRYRLRVSAAAAVNPAPPVLLSSPVFALRAPPPPAR
jgi:hypothetical protein